ncbi:MAG: 4-hydroxy-tetrahydrodipicolinate reductase [Candidatus Sumerlaeota bacterium]
MTTKIIMCGAGGRMGHAILRCAAEDEAFSIGGGIEAPGHPMAGQEIGPLIGALDVKEKIVTDPDEIDISGPAATIHFSAPEATLEQLNWSKNHDIPAVIGTTGFNMDQREQIRKVSETLPVVLAPNMSVGVNTLFRLVREAARILDEEYDVEITEIHHRFKKDSPSGTARRLGEIVAEERGSIYEDLVVDGRSGMVGERPKGEIGMHALRGGDVVGEHTVNFVTMGQRLELTHRAHNRDNFARGSLQAAEWLQGRDAGLYDMEDVLGLKSL